MQDNEIIELYWQRNESAIAETDRSYGKYCHRIAMNVLDNTEDADECVSDTWFRTWNSIPEDRPAHFRGYLAKITRHIAIDRWRLLTAAKRGNGNVTLALDELGECVSGSDSVESEYAAKELAASIDIFINRLSEKEQRLFMWRYFYMEPVQNIAERMQMSPNHTAVILSRIRNRLKRFLQEEGYEV